jgi:tetratricopeptide (TPR) repeat protein
MLKLAIIATFTFGFIGATFVLLLGVSFTRVQRDRFPFLKKLDGKQVHFAGAAILCLALGYGFNVWKEILAVQMSFELSQGPRGENVLKTTSIGFEEELRTIAGERIAEARAFFAVAESEFSKSSFQTAAENYKRSMEILPTMSASLNLGISLHYLSDYANSEAAFLSGLGLSEKYENRGFKARFLDNLGLVYRQTGRANESIDSHQRAIDLFRQVEDKKGEAYALKNLGASLIGQSRFDDAIGHLENALRLFKTIDDKLGEGSVLNNLGICYQYLGRIEESLRSYESAIEAYKQAGNPPVALGSALTNLGNVYRIKGDSKAAIDYYERAAKSYESVGHKAGLSAVYVNLGSAHYQFSEFDRALAVLNSALDLCKQMNAVPCQGDCFGLIGMINNEQGNYEDALNATWNSLKIRDQIGDQVGKANNLIVLCEIHAHQNKFSDATQYCNSALSLARQINSPAPEANALNSLAYAQYRFGNYVEAAKNANKALAMHQNLDDALGIGNAFTLKGAVFVQQRRHAEAVQELSKAIEIQKKVGNEVGVANALGLLGRAYTSLGTSDLALESLQAASEIFRRLGIKSNEASLVEGALSEIRGKTP